MSMANGALPWMVFQRDQERFSREFPDLSLKYQDFRYPFLYLLSGGVSMRQLLPNSFLPLVRAGEWMLKPVSPLLGLFTGLVIEKRQGVSLR